ncbi:SDR family NAD(P)-dependent oxidoreductase [Ciceribacter sp. L1K23]|uniref:SDR family NAD(P)-dependent oxidoreductase n=1 Tax=Ciceribacter sp. L1K23 TaxID=2820276 RepID=UPI001B830D6F|nr:SDR family NAD(P)-dependent oxidoreductase [Ciceribacter sp. L1K23]MBR0558001.1 SDR family NAD(P)-dependent oxidoreductase [Ciceribacter sp. L1K23]
MAEQNVVYGDRGVAWVTGASSGIGRALCLALVDDGWTVVASARGEAALASLAAERTGRIVPLPLDISNKVAVSAAVAQIEAANGPVSLAVLCAGTYERDDPKAFDSAKLQRMMDLNVVGTAHCLEALLPPMLSRRAGRISVVSSVSGYTGLPGAAFYGATKAALINMCEALYPELERNGVKLSVVAPGFVETPLTAKNDFPMPFIVTAEEAARSILSGLKDDRFLISFPWKMALSMRLLSYLPYRLRFALTKRMLRKD